MPLPMAPEKLALLIAALLLISAEAFGSKKNYIVILKSLGYREKYSGFSKLGEASRLNFRTQALAQHNRILDKVDGKKVHDYFELANGFSALLTDDQAQSLKKDPEVLFIAKDSMRKLLTSQSFRFLDLQNTKNGIWRKTIGRDAIVGIIDTGVWPESASFSDKGFGSPPSKFKGSCESGTDTFKCNKKLIGARYFGDGFAAAYGTTIDFLADYCGDVLSPRDFDGHGSHTASTAAGAQVGNISVSGMNLGSPRGIAFGARVVAYKVFWCNGGAFTSDILSAFDQGVVDGVDVLSLSLGANPSQPGDSMIDPMMYFSLKATFAGVPVVFAGGNDGPTWFTVSNSAPWVLTIAASTIDRDIVSKVVLGNNVTFQGSSIGNPGTLRYTSNKKFPLIFSEKAYRLNQADAKLCVNGSLSATKVKGKIVLCLRGNIPLIEKVNNVKAAGGVGVIIYNPATSGESTLAISGSFPLAIVPYSAALKLLAYMNSTKTPSGLIGKSILISGADKVEAPKAASFSSTGPNGASFNIMKPDVSAPGVSILAAYSPKSGNPYEMLSGTSMATPHVAGVIALLKTIHPKWLPSYYFSALQTTASQYTNRKNFFPSANGKRATPFTIGSGHVNPNAAADPGLVYPISNTAYRTFLCSPDSGLGSADSVVDSSLFCKTYPSTKAVDLNIPSITFYRSAVEKTSRTTRTLKNVGPAATYYAKVFSPAGSTLKVSPTKLTFAKDRSLTYNITITPKRASSKVRGSTLTESTSTNTVTAKMYWTFGAIYWSDNKGHQVRSAVSLNAI